MTEKDNRVDYLKYVNTFGITLVTFFAGYMSMDIRDIKQAQQTQAVEQMRLDTNQKTIFRSVEVLNQTDKEIKDEVNSIKREWLTAIQELNNKIKR